MSKKRKKARRLARKKSRNRRKILQMASYGLPQNKCIFCGATESLQKHHIIQKRFGGSDSANNLVPVCPRCHLTYHRLTDILLNYLLLTGSIKRHQILEEQDSD